MSNFEPQDLVMDVGGRDAPGGGQPGELYVIQGKKPDSDETYYSLSLWRPEMNVLHIYGPNARKLCSFKNVPTNVRALYRYKEIADRGRGHPGTFGTLLTTLLSLIDQLELVVSEHTEPEDRPE